MDKAGLRSCWIQRLNPACQTSAFEEEELTEPSHVWTHFAKDFSSCSKRLQKARHHTRSSSWPPNERTTKFSPSPELKLAEAVDIKEQYLLSRTALPMFKEENLRVPVSESNDFCLKTGKPFSNQNSSPKSSEARVPCSHATRTCDEFHEGESKDEDKLKSFAAQHFQWLSKDSASAVGDITLLKKPFLNPNFSKESGSLQEVGSTRVLGDAPCKGKFVASELAHRMVHVRGSSPDAVIGTTLSPALMGASADADDRIHLSPSLIKAVYPLPINRPAVVFGDTENKINEDQLGVAPKKTSGKVWGKEVKTGRNFGFLHFAGQSKTSNQSPASDNVGVRNRGSGVSMASKSIQRKQSAGFGTFATNAGPFVTKDFYNLQSFNTDSKRHDPIVADHPLNLKEELTTKMPLTRVASGDFTRPIFRETSLDDYWVKPFKDSEPVKLLDTSYSKATPLPSPHIPLNTNIQTRYSCDVPQQTQASLSSSFIQTRQTGLEYNQCASADRSPLEGSSKLRTLQEESMQGGMRRLVSQTDQNEHKFCADGRTAKPSRPNQAWIQRWYSSSNLISMSGKTPSPFFGMDKELGSAPTKRPVITNYEGKGMDCFDPNMIEPYRGTDKLHMEGSARHYDSGLGPTLRGSFPVYRSHASLGGKYMAPSAEAMAMVGNTSSNLRSISLQNRGSFSVWPFPSKENFQERRLSQHAKETVEDNMHGMDMDDLEFLEYKMR